MRHNPAHFADALLANTVPPPGLRNAARFAIHRNNVLAGLVKVLEARFPVTRRLVGDAFFAMMAADFVRASPPHSPVLLEYGEALPAFIAAFIPARDLAYLPDVARLEYALHAATHGAEATPLEGGALQQVPPECMAELSLSLHPTLMLLESRYPIVSIWRANQPGESGVVAAGLPGEAALVVRPHLIPVLDIVPAAALPFIAGLADGLALGTAAERAADPAFDLTAALVLLLQCGAITGFHLET